MATNNFLVFDEQKQNMLSDQDYSAATQRLVGVQAGIASSRLQNKTLHQTSLIAAAIAQIMNENGIDATDENFTTFADLLGKTLVQKVKDKATQAEVNSGTNDEKFVTPKTLKGGIGANVPNADEIGQIQGLDTVFRRVDVLTNRIVMPMGSGVNAIMAQGNFARTERIRMMNPLNTDRHPVNVTMFDDDRMVAVDCATGENGNMLGVPSTLSGGRCSNGDYIIATHSRSNQFTVFTVDGNLRITSRTVTTQKSDISLVADSAYIATSSQFCWFAYNVSATSERGIACYNGNNFSASLYEVSGARCVCEIDARNALFVTNENNSVYAGQIDVSGAISNKHALSKPPNSTDSSQAMGCAYDPKSGRFAVQYSDNKFAIYDLNAPSGVYVYGGATPGQGNVVVCTDGAFLLGGCRIMAGNGVVYTQNYTELMPNVVGSSGNLYVSYRQSGAVSTYDGVVCDGTNAYYGSMYAQGGIRSGT